MHESKVLEFKESVTNTFLKTVSAFANYGGGQILFGVNDDGMPIGVENPDQACLDIENRLNDSIDPKPDYTLEINRRTNVITLSIHDGRWKPYLYKAKAYKRNGTATVATDRLEFTRLILEGENLTFDELESKKQELEFGVLEASLKEALGIELFSRDTLRTLGLLTKEQKFNNAAELLADINGFMGIDIVRFGESISYILDRETADGISVLRQYQCAIDLFQKYYQYEVIDGVKRRTVDMIPENAFREAIANALVHRAWDVNANIKISMFEDKIEVVSPGGLPNGVTKKDYLSGHVSILRNPVLGDVFFRLHLMERFGTGVQRIIESYSQNRRRPDFDISENVIRIVLPVLSLSNLSNEQEKVYNMMANNKSVTSGEVASYLGCGKSKATGILKSLVEEDYVQVVGRGRGTRYRHKS